MNTPSRFVLVAVAIALAGAACSSADVAATVNGSDISEPFVLSLRTEYEGEMTVSGDTFRNDLTRLIFTEAMITGAEADFGLTGLDTQAARDAYLETASPTEQQYLSSVSEDPAFTDVIVDVAITQLVVRSAVQEALVLEEENLQRVWEDFQGNLTQVCVRHILTASEPEAQAVRARLDAGEDFASVASDVTIDSTTPDGVLPCPVPLSAYVGPFGFAILNAPVGEAAGPFQTQFGWHVIVVDLLESPSSLAELSEDPLKWVTPEVLDVFWAPWFNDVVERSEITVRSDIGMWYPAVDGIIAPDSSP